MLGGKASSFCCYCTPSQFCLKIHSVKYRDNLSEYMASTPFVTIIIPIRNETHYIERTLNAVIAQNYPSNRMEVLIVDGMSSDGTRKICKQITQKASGIQFRILDNHKKIVPAALNIGFREAKGEIIIRVDGHCEIAPDYVRQCVRFLLEENDNVQ
jgi:succinoglycan biosynthesis protein ExoA